MMEPGDRDRYVRIERLVEPAPPSEDFPVDDWETLDSVWMTKQELTAFQRRERFAEGQLTAPFDSIWQMPYREDMDPELVDVAKKRRLVYQGRTYDITFARQIERREGVEMTTLARQG